MKIKTTIFLFLSAVIAAALFRIFGGSFYEQPRPYVTSANIGRIGSNYFYYIQMTPMTRASNLRIEGTIDKTNWFLLRSLTVPPMRDTVDGVITFDTPVSAMRLTYQK